MIEMDRVWSSISLSWPSLSPWSVGHSGKSFPACRSSSMMSTSKSGLKVRSAGPGFCRSPVGPDDPGTGDLRRHRTQPGCGHPAGAGQQHGSSRPGTVPGSLPMELCQGSDPDRHGPERAGCIGEYINLQVLDAAGIVRSSAWLSGSPFGTTFILVASAPFQADIPFLAEPVLTIRVQHWGIVERYP